MSILPNRHLDKPYTMHIMNQNQAWVKYEHFASMEECHEEARQLRSGDKKLPKMWTKALLDSIKVTGKGIHYI
jgi:hypothetical protein